MRFERTPTRSHASSAASGPSQHSQFANGSYDHAETPSTIANPPITRKTTVDNSSAAQRPIHRRCAAYRLATPARTPINAQTAVNTARTANPSPPHAPAAACRDITSPLGDTSNTTAPT